MHVAGLAAVMARRYGGPRNSVMNSTTTSTPGRVRAHASALPNILTYARIAAVPVVVGCMFSQAILGGGLWLRWVALTIFIAAGITDFLDGYFARIWGPRSAACSIRSPTSSWWRRAC